MINVSIVGCTGYVGEELIRLSDAHPQMKIVHLISKSFSDKKLSDIYPNYYGKKDKQLEAMDIDAIIRDSDVVFMALPHGTSADVMMKLIDKGVKIIDLSGDFRYDDTAVYEAWYSTTHHAKAINDRVIYGMSELYQDKIREADYIANPGCYTTCAILPLFPLLKANVVRPNGIIIDAKSGVSGAGRKESLALSFCEAHENFKAYGVATHRHTSEIEQELTKAAGKDVMVSFTPHLLPIKRGILATAYCSLTKDSTRADVLKAYSDYSDKPFIHVMEDGLPEIKQIAGSNNLYIGFEIDKRTNRLVIVSALDNLIKGAGGQAIQNMNLMFGFDETEGLNPIGFYL